MLLDSGNLLFSGDVMDAIAQYMEGVSSSAAEVSFPADEGKAMQVRAAQLTDDSGNVSTELDRVKGFTVTVDYDVRRRIEGAHLGVMLDRIDGTPVCYAVDIDAAADGTIDRMPGSYRTSVSFPGNLLNSGVYQIRIGLAKFGGHAYDYCEPFLFHLNDHGTFAATGASGQQRQGVLAIPLDWRTEQIC
jgi:hypothetical protein